LTELRVICATAGERGQPTSLSRGLITIRRNYSRKVDKMVLKCIITKGRNSEYRY